MYGGTAHPALIYLPGLHGDWTLVASFRAALKNRVCFIEITYPRTVSWSLEDYARSVLAALDAAGIHGGWLLGESFSSQVAWAILDRAPRSQFAVQGIILAGGFVRYPAPWVARCVQRINRRVPMRWLERFCRVYAWYARLRHAHAPETLAQIAEFVHRRLVEADRQAICHRYSLLIENDPRRIARECVVPVFYLTGFFDPVVPWFHVRPWLKRHCPACRAFKLVWRADHHVLGTAPAVCARAILQWMSTENHVDCKQDEKDVGGQL